MEDVWIRTNPVPITKLEDVNVILNMAFGDDLPAVQSK